MHQADFNRKKKSGETEIGNENNFRRSLRQRHQRDE